MASVLSKEKIATIHRLAREGRNGRQIAAETGIGRESVYTYWPEDVVKPSASTAPRPSPAKKPEELEEPDGLSPDMAATQRLTAELQPGFRDIPDSFLAAEERWRRWHRMPSRAATAVRTSDGWPWP